MTVKADKDIKYRLLKALRGGKPAFINTADAAAIEAFRDRHSNLDLFMSTWSSSTPDPSAPRNYDLRFHIAAPDLETARVSALQTAYYITENFNIPDEYLDIVYDGGGKVGANATGRGDHDGETGQIAGKSRNMADGRVNSSTAGPGNPDHAGEKAAPNSGGCRSSGNAKEGTSAAGITISIPPVVFGWQPTPLMPASNYHLARQMADGGIKSIDIDAYQRDHWVALPNSIRGITGRFILPLSLKELLYLDGNGITELAKQPKPEDSLIMPRPVSEAAEWYAETLAEFEKRQRQQDDLRKSVLDNGWEVPPCLRHLMRLRLYDHNRLEAYRVISQFFAAIQAGPRELGHLIHTVDRRNPLRDSQRINAIITFAAENPWFAGCKHPLLQQFCPAGGCFMAEMIKEYEQPRLFEQV